MEDEAIGMDMKSSITKVMRMSRPMTRVETWA